MAISPEVAPWATLAVVVIGNVVGWVSMGRRQKNSEHRKIEIEQKWHDDVQNLAQHNKELIEALPCVSDKNYMKEQGVLNQKVDGLEKNQDKMDEKLDAILGEIKKNNGHS